MESLALSPNGQLLAWIESDAVKPVLRVFDLSKSAQVSSVKVPEGLSVRRLDWSDDRVLLIHAVVIQASGEFSALDPYRTVAADVTTGKSRMLPYTTGDSDYSAEARLRALRTSKPHKVITSSRTGVPNLINGSFWRQVGEPGFGRDDDRFGLHLFEVDTLTDEVAVVHWGKMQTHRWIVDAHGQVVARSEYVDRWKLFTVLHRRETQWVEIFRLESGEKPELLGLAPDRKTLLMRARWKRDHLALWRLPLNGATPELLIADDADDVTKLVRDPHSQDVLGAWTGGLAPEVRWIDEQAEKRAQSLHKTFGGKQVDLLGRSADGTRALVGVGAHATPVTYYLVDFKRGTADIVGEQYPELTGVRFGEVRTLKYKARDGYEIPAYLTLPPGRSPEKLPMVVLPHDGPESRDETKFDDVAQFLATRGYAVLQPQFRGSTGFGEAHREAGYREWGGLMQEDVSDGVKAMIEQGIADPRRICIAGIGYGGYSALAGAAFTADLYACAISVNGVSELPELIAHLRRELYNGDPLVKYFEATVGQKKSRDISARSPARAAPQVTAPILLLHSVDAEVIPFTQSKTMFEALRGQPPHELIELPGADVSRGPNRIRMLAEMERFLARHLAGQ